MGSTKQHQQLTDLAIRKLDLAPGHRVEIWDARIPGFGVRASGGGTKSFVLVYRFRGRARRMTLGRFPVVSLSEARQMASTALLKVARGEDPEETRGPAAAATRSFASVFEEFIQRYCAQHNRPSTAAETERLIRTKFLREWRGRDIREITREEVNAVLDTIVAEGKPAAANHALAAIRKMFNWSVERGLIAASPCQSIRQPAKPGRRERVLPETEVGSVWRAAQAAAQPYGSIVMLLMLTAQRRNDVVSMRWCDLDLEAGLWTIPAEAAKSNRTHTVPLTPRVVEVIAACPRVHDVYVFPSQGKDRSVFSGFSKSKRSLDDASGVADWTLHDLRRTAATHMARLGVAPHVIERILNHSTGVLGGVAGIYNRFSYLPEMRAALEKWSDTVIAVGRQHGAASQNVAAGRGEA